MNEGNLAVTQALVAALALVMFGLGLSLTVSDFTRLLKHPKAVAIALALQIVVLPVPAMRSSCCSRCRRCSRWA